MRPKKISQHCGVGVASWEEQVREEPGLVGLIHRLQHGIRFEQQEQVSKRIDKFESQLQTYI